MASAQLRLPVSLHASNADHLTAVHLEGNIFHRRQPHFIATGDIFRVQDHISRVEFVLIDLQYNFPAHHHHGDFLLICIFGVNLGRHHTGPHHGDPVRYQFDLANLWVIKMMHFPFFFKFISVSISCRISWGVRTAVGSSIIRISAPRYSAFKISTLC